MATWQPDPSFYPSPRLAAKAPAETIAYVAAFAGNTWEVFAVRVWFVAYLAWLLRLPGNHIALPALGLVSGAASMAGVPVSMIMAVLAIPFSLSTGKKGAVTGVAVAVGIAVFYTVVSRLFEAMGDVSQLPPALAAWSPDLIFVLVGAYLILKVPT